MRIQRFCASTLLALSIVASVLCIASPSWADVQLQVDYTYDNGFFSSGSTARSTLEAACNFFNSLLKDNFLAINSSTENHFTGYIYRPDTGAWSSLGDLNIPANKIRLYVGTRYLSSGILGLGGPGGYSASYTSESWYTDAVTRGQGSAVTDVEGYSATEFAPWGGSIAFDADTFWNLNHTIKPTSGQTDLYSVILHEIGHVLGIGTADSWDNLIIGNSFTGEAVVEEYGDWVSVTTDGGHWADNIYSTVFGVSDPQEAAMTPYISSGIRKVMTELDVAGLDDIGWQLVVPEPSTIALLLSALFVIAVLRPTSRRRAG